MFGNSCSLQYVVSSRQYREEPRPPGHVSTTIISGIARTVEKATEMDVGKTPTFTLHWYTKLCLVTRYDTC